MRQFLKSTSARLGGDKFYSLADTTLLSAFRLGSNVLIAAWGGVDQFSAFVMLVSIQVVLSSLVATHMETPMLSITPGLGKQQRLSFFAWSQSRAARQRYKLTGILALLFPISAWIGIEYLTYLCFVLALHFTLSLQHYRAQSFASFQSKEILRVDLLIPLFTIGASFVAWKHADNPLLGYWIGQAIASAIACQLAKRKIPTTKNKVDTSLSEKAIRDGRAMLAGSAANNVCSRVQPFFLNAVGGAGIVASYGAALALLGPIRLAIMALANLLRPRLALLWNAGNHKKFRQRIHSAYLAIALIGGLCTIALMLVGPWLSAFVFNHELQISRIVILFAALYAVLDAATTLQMISAQISQKQGAKTTSSARIQSALVSITLLIPTAILWGATGAFASLIFAELFYSVKVYRNCRYQTDYPQTNKTFSLAANEISRPPFLT